MAPPNHKRSSHFRHYGANSTAPLCRSDSTTPFHQCCGSQQYIWPRGRAMEQGSTARLLALTIYEEWGEYKRALEWQEPECAPWWKKNSCCFVCIIDGEEADRSLLTGVNILPDNGASVRAISYALRVSPMASCTENPTNEDHSLAPMNTQCLHLLSC